MDSGDKSHNMQNKVCVQYIYKITKDVASGINGTAG